MSNVEKCDPCAVKAVTAEVGTFALSSKLIVGTVYDMILVAVPVFVKTDTKTFRVPCAPRATLTHVSVCDNQIECNDTVLPMLPIAVKSVNESCPPVMVTIDDPVVAAFTSTLLDTTTLSKVTAHVAVAI